MRARGDEEVLSMCRSKHGVESLSDRTCLEFESSSVRENAVHREPDASEVIGRRVENDEVHSRRRSVVESIAHGIGAPSERVVERIEVRPLRDCGALSIDGSVVGNGVAIES